MSFSHVQGKSATSGPATTHAITLNSAPTAGNLICVAIGTGSVIASCTLQDGNGNSYTKTPNSPSLLAGVAQTFCFYLLKVPSGASATITATFSSSSSAWMFAEEFSVSGGDAAFDTDAAGSGTGTAINTPTLTPAGSGELMYMGANVGGTISSPSSGGTRGDWTGSSGAVANGNICEYILNASTAEAANFLQSPSDVWITMGMAFKITPSSVSGSETSSQAAQSLSASGSEAFAGSESSAQASQSLAAAGSEVFTGSETSMQTAQSLAASGAEDFAASETSDQASQSLAASGALVFSASATTDQATQSLSVSGTLEFTGDIATAQATQDVLAGSTDRTGAGATDQHRQTLSSSGSNTRPASNQTGAGSSSGFVSLRRERPEPQKKKAAKVAAIRGKAAAASRPQVLFASGTILQHVALPASHVDGSCSLTSPISQLVAAGELSDPMLEAISAVMFEMF